MSKKNEKERLADPEKEPEAEPPKEPEKKKEQKIIYIDDGSTVADMSGTFKKGPPKPRSTAKEKARTYFAVVKKMIVPMLCTLLAFTLVFVFMLAIAGKLW